MDPASLPGSVPSSQESSEVQSPYECVVQGLGAVRNAAMDGGRTIKESTAPPTPPLPPSLTPPGMDSPAGKGEGDNDCAN